MYVLCWCRNVSVICRSFDGRKILEFGRIECCWWRPDIHSSIQYIPFLPCAYHDILTFIMVLLHTGTNFPAVSVNSLLAVAMMKTRQRWNETGVPTQSHPQTASLTLSAWNNVMLFYTENTRVQYVFVLMLMWKFVFFTWSVSRFPSQQYTNKLHINPQYMIRACDTSVKSPQL